MKPHQEYVRALLGNPEFIKQVYYGNGERMTIVNLAKVIDDLDTAMYERFVDSNPLAPRCGECRNECEDDGNVPMNTNGSGWDPKSGPHGNGSKACVCAACDIGSQE